MTVNQNHRSMDSIGENISLYREISKKVYGDISYMNVLRVSAIIKKFAEKLPLEMLAREFRYSGMTIKRGIAIKIRQHYKSNKELLLSYEKGDFSLYNVELIIEISDDIKKCIKSIKFVKEINDRLNSIIDNDKVLKKYYHEINLS